MGINVFDGMFGGGGGGGWRPGRGDPTTGMFSRYNASGGGGAPVANVGAQVNGGGLKGLVASGGQLNMQNMVANMPDYRGITDASGNLKQGFGYNPQQIKYGGLDSYDAYKGFALGKGPSEMYKTQASAIDMSGKQNLDSIREDNARGLSSGMSQLATQGGIDSGARERLARGASSDRLRAGQNVYAGMAQQKAQAGAQDAQMRFGALQGLTQMDTQRRNLNTGIVNNGMMTNLNNRIGDMRGGNAYDLEQFGQVGNIYGSDQNYQAMMAAANKEAPGMLGMGGFLGTGLGGQQGVGGSGFGSQQWDNNTIKKPFYNTFGTNGPWGG